MLPKPPDQIAALLARPVAIFGAGVSGQGVLALLGALGAKGGVSYWNDSKVTNFQAAEAAMAGFASFELFRDYDDRGRQFQQLVENL